jgi:catechol 2,3-dioxygenase-like lactoylglutathione lyase family enzyme
MIGQLYNVVLDCREPAELARFYAALLGASVADGADDDWVVVADDAGTRLCFQRSPEHEPPRFPDPTGSQQSHLDVMVADIEEAQRAVLELGATRLDGEGEDFRVFADPAGHTFCLVWRN